MIEEIYLRNNNAEIITRLDDRRNIFTQQQSRNYYTPG